MRHRTAVLASLLVLTTTFAGRVAPVSAQPRARTTFATTTAFHGCHTSWALACRIPTGHGGTYGTAHPMQRCTSMSFAPDGTFTLDADMISERGTYRIVAGKIRLSVREEDGAVRTWDLPLSADRATLGDLRRK